MLRNFVAVLKDSFREAIDGWVIYVMLGLAFLTILVAASISFEAQSADAAFPVMVKEFGRAFQKRGASNEQVGTKFYVGNISARIPLPVEYSALDIQKLDSKSGVPGRYSLTLIAKNGDYREEGKKPGGGNADGGLGLPFGLKLQSDNFRTVVASWNQPQVKDQSVLVKVESDAFPPPFEMVPDGEDPEEALKKKRTADPDKGKGRWMLIATPTVTQEEIKGVTDEMMGDFIKNQFLLHSDIESVTVKRKAGAKEPEYRFDVDVELKAAPKGWPYKMSMFFGGLPMGDARPYGLIVFDLLNIFVNIVGSSVILLVSVVLTGFFIPNMLRKGSVDLVIAKPISRWELLLYKYIGGLTFVFLVSTMTVGGVWFVIALRTGNWSPTFLLGIPMLTFTFGVLYAISTLTAVLTRSAIAAILVTSLFMTLMGVVGFIKSINDVAVSVVDDKSKLDKAYLVFVDTIDIANLVLPRYNDILRLNSKVLGDEMRSVAYVRENDRLKYSTWFEATSVTVLYIAVFLGLSYWRFATRDP